MQTLRLQTIYWLAGLATALGCLLLGSMLFLNSLEEYRRYDAGTNELARFHYALVVANRVSAERGPANSVMGAASENPDQLAGSLTTARKLTDQAIANMENSFRKEFSDSARLAELARLLRLQLASGRKAVDAVAGEPPEARDGERLVHAIEQMFLAADAAALLRDHIGRAIIDRFPQISTEILLSSVSSNMREHAGRLGSYVVMMLTSPVSAHADFDRKLAATEGRLEELRTLALNYSGAFLGIPSIQDTLVQVQNEYFARTLAYTQHVLLHEVGKPDPISAAEFTRRYVPGMKPLETLRELIGGVSERRVSEARSQAARMLMFSGIVTLLVCTVLVFISIALHRLLFRPLMIAKEQIVAIVQGDLSDPVVDSQLSKEIRETFDGLQVLRENQRRKKMLEQDQQRMASQLKRLSETDELSGLLNRRALEAVARKMIPEADARGKRMGLILFDIDHFKTINDTYGHGTGDHVIQRIGQTLLPVLRPRDTLARFGGEEFIVLIPNTNEHELQVIAERLRKTLAILPITPADLSRTITASFGIAVREPGGESWEALVAVADKRLYTAKRLGRNRVCAKTEDPPAPHPGPALDPEPNAAAAS